MIFHDFLTSANGRCPFFEVVNSHCMRDGKLTNQKAKSTEIQN